MSRSAPSVSREAAGRPAPAAVVFDLDGVVTRTADVHAAAWKRLFDDYRAELLARGEPGFAPFDATEDYRRYVDGLPRYDGVSGFLASRGIALPRGSPQDGPGDETVCGLGNRKNAIFRALLREQGVEPYATTVDLVRGLRAAGVRTAIVSSSRNCADVLEAAGIAGLFDVRVDGVDLEALGLPGKPAPDLFLEAARRLGVSPSQAVVVEDALAGVEAGRRGGFGLVVGVDRARQAAALRDAGADVVVDDLGRFEGRLPERVR